MRNKFIFQLIVTASVAGLMSFLVSSPAVKASILDNFLGKYFSGFTTQSQPEKIIERTILYESKDVHEEAVISAVDKAAPSVVSIIVSKDLPVIEQCPYDPFSDLPDELKQFFGGRFEVSRPCQTGYKKQEVGGGSGFIISGDGMILTNKHVVSDEKADYTVLMNDGKKYEAKVLARDSAQDLAVVKIEVSGLNPLKLGDSDSIRLGQTAIAIGNALGEFRNTVSAGVISGLARKLTTSTNQGESESLDGLIQTDAAINPGNSGGPLLNLRGEVIGINTAVASGAQNIGFAIPINKAKRDINSVKATGKITFPYLGVRYTAINNDLAQKEKLSVKQGAFIRGGEDGPAIMKDSPASKAGLMAEDIILEINGQKIDENNSLSSVIQQYLVGDKLKIKILRSGKEMDVEAVLEEKKF